MTTLTLGADEATYHNMAEFSKMVLASGIKAFVWPASFLLQNIYIKKGEEFGSGNVLELYMLGNH